MRLTFTTKNDTVTARALETAAATTEQGEFIGYSSIRKVNSTLFDHTATGATHFAERLSGSTNEKIGLAKSISVMPGDTINIEVLAKYVDASNSGNSTGLTNLVAQIAAGTASAGTVVDGSGYATSGATTFPFAGLSGAGTESGTGPKAYLDFISFDRSYHPIINDVSQTNFVRMTTAGKENGSIVPHERLYAQVVVKQPGYMYIYLSNDNPTPVEVYFDDFKVQRINSPIIQKDDYYPFGLTFNSYQRENTHLNKFKFQSQEHIDDLGLGFFQMEKRSARYWKIF